MAKTKSKWINGNLVFYDTYPFRIVEAFGSNIIKLNEHFSSTPADDTTNIPTAWVATAVGTSPITFPAGSDYGELLLTSGASENDGVQIQLRGESFKIVSGTPLYFGCRFKINDETQSDFLVGLAITDTTAIAALSDGIYFRKVDGTTAVTFELEKDSTETSSAAYTCDTSYHIVEFYYDGSHINWYVDGTAMTRPAETNLCDDEYLTPTIAVLTGEGNACALTVDWIRAFELYA